MSISLEKADFHVRRWSREFARFPMRANWPQHLFHTTQIEVAVEIVANGGVICRDAVPELIYDVANQGALWNNPAAHSYVRLYFRPRNNFHLKTEGIKSLSDQYRCDPHMSIPISFAFDFKKVMTLPSSRFVFGNFALSNQDILTGDVAFGNLDFSLIYHDLPPPPDRRSEIQNARMSEAVVENFLSLEHLSCIICRTVHEERMLRYLLRGKILQLPPILVEQRGAVFFRKGIFIDEIWWQADELHLKFQTPTTASQESYCL